MLENISLKNLSDDITYTTPRGTLKGDWRLSQNIYYKDYVKNITTIKGNGSNSFSQSIDIVKDFNYGSRKEFDVIGNGLTEGNIVINEEHNEKASQDAERSGKIHITNFASISINNLLTQEKFDNSVNFDGDK
ncbi:hypothetical protein, partial [Succinatimonas hippei]|uniref:hypothetical protein n=1 Tax=Succinatimonas hippei TaxID=626938 RepID=UPI0026EFF8FE